MLDPLCTEPASVTSGACREKPGFTLGRRLLANRFLLLAAGCLQRPTPPVGERTSECVFASCLQAVVVGGVQRSCRPGTPAPPPGGLPDFDCCTHCTTSRHPARHTARRKNCQAWLITAVNIPSMHAWTNWHTRVAPRLVEMHQTFFLTPEQRGTRRGSCSRPHATKLEGWQREADSRPGQHTSLDAVMIATMTGLHEPKKFTRGSGQSWFGGDLVQTLASSQDV